MHQVELSLGKPPILYYNLRSLLTIQFPANMSEKQQVMAQMTGTLKPCGKPGWSFRLLALVWPTLVVAGI